MLINCFGTAAVSIKHILFARKAYKCLYKGLFCFSNVKVMPCDTHFFLENYIMYAIGFFNYTVIFFSHCTVVL